MRNLFENIVERCDEAELYKVENYSTGLSILNGGIQSVKGSKTLGLALRINKDGRYGSAVATSLDDESIIERAILSSQYQKEETLKFKNLPVEDVKCYDEKLASMSAEELTTEGLRILDLFKSIDESIIPDVQINRSVQEIHIINTSGFDHSYNRTQYEVRVMTKSKEGFMEVNSSIFSANFRAFTKEEVAAIIKKHKISQNRVNVPTGKMPVVFSGNAMGSLMTRLLSGVNAGNVIKKVSPLENKIGERIASEVITIKDHGKLENGFASCPFDDEGIPTNETVLVEKGILKNYLVSVSGEEKLNMKATGNAFKRTMFSNDIEDQPAIDSSNFLIEGTNQLADDELIKNIKKGIYIDSVMGTHTGNIPAGEYSLNIGCGYLIEDGKLVGKVMDTMVSGNIYEDLMKIEAVGTKLEPMGVIFYTMGYSPAILFNGLSVVGS
ncbi:TldD/PmbA family protein [Alkaliphilus transvaalensis]|uniref:TldD/PmbA family protein n=1 Tax=Alkaliphilus transvaalensis TaxID=114628 RepID=UPI0004787652|nr:TldD/PmbA family protein [Alkaliphilus transvaalensis]